MPLPTKLELAGATQGYGTEYKLEEPNSMTPTAKKKMSCQEMDRVSINRQSEHVKESVSSVNTAPV